jgi:hypothetical protein
MFGEGAIYVWGSRERFVEWGRPNASNLRGARHPSLEAPTASQRLHRVWVVYMREGQLPRGLRWLRGVYFGKVGQPES